MENRLGLVDVDLTYWHIINTNIFLFFKLDLDESRYLNFVFLFLRTESMDDNINNAGLPVI